MKPKKNKEVGTVEHRGSLPVYVMVTVVVLVVYLCSLTVCGSKSLLCSLLHVDELSLSSPAW